MPIPDLNLLMPFAGVVAGVLGTWGVSTINGFFQVRAQVRAAAPTIQAAASKAASDAQAAVLSGMAVLINELQEERKELIAEIRAQSAEIRSQRASIDGLTRQVADLSTHIDSLERVMRAHGLTPPARPVWSPSLVLTPT